MKVEYSPSETLYRLSAAERDEYANWLDIVLITSEPEDVTGTIFIDNFVQDDKFHRFASGGLVSAIKRRLPYDGHVLSDVVIEKDEIHEANAAKGIYFDVSDPKIGEYFTMYEAQLIQEGYSDPRYNGRMFLCATPPNDEDGRYSVQLLRSLHRGIPSRTGSDLISYTLPPDKDIIEAKIAVDPKDIVLGQILSRPFKPDELAVNSLKIHAQFISKTLGIDPPDFIA